MGALNPMLDADWAACKVLRPLGVPDWRQVDRDLLLRVDAWAQVVGPVVITFTVGGSHVSDSQHYLGLAVDVTPKGAIDRTMTADAWLDAYLAAERLRFTGIGLYPFWNRPGFHLDLRSERDLAAHQGRGARWWRDKGGLYQGLDWRGLGQVAQIVGAALKPPTA